MCLGIPMKVVKIEDKTCPTTGRRVGTVEVGGVKKLVNLQLLKEVEVGDYVIVHAGFAIQKLDVEDAEERLKLLRQWGETLA